VELLGGLDQFDVGGHQNEIEGALKSLLTKLLSGREMKGIRTA
jgi:hypothetical protein